MHFNFLLLLTQFLYGPHPEHVAGSFLSLLDVTCIVIRFYLAAVVFL